ncbi:MAG: hypothetical protein GX640_08010, partial [Fibrobacter sp.]|nr:hypothetical protein [Fibrobacter sp.]
MKLSQILFFLSTIILAYRSRKRWFGWVNALNTEEEVKQYIYRHLIKPKLLKPPYLEWSGILIFTMGFGETRDVNKKVEFGMLSAILGNTLDMCDDVFDQFEQSYEGKVGFLRDMLE